MYSTVSIYKFQHHFRLSVSRIVVRLSIDFLPLVLFLSVSLSTITLSLSPNGTPEGNHRAPLPTCQLYLSTDHPASWIVCRRIESLAWVQASRRTPQSHLRRWTEDEEGLGAYCAFTEWWKGIVTYVVWDEMHMLDDREDSSLTTSRKSSATLMSWVLKCSSDATGSPLTQRSERQRSAVCGLALSFDRSLVLEASGSEGAKDRGSAQGFKSLLRGPQLKGS